MGADLFGPSDVPRMVALSDLRGVDLTAEEGFLLSRIDGRINVGSLLTLVSWERDKTMSLLESLLRKHVVNFDRREIHDAVERPSNPQGPRPATKPDAEAAAPIDRASIETVADMDQDRCVEILEWERVVAAAQTLYQIFSLPEGADPRSVKRRYREMAMSFHPDKFFRKDIGGYRARVEGAWKRVQEAYDTLQDPALRARYEKEQAEKPRVAPAAANPNAPSRAPGSKETVTGPGRAPAGFVNPMVIAPLDDFERATTDDIPVVQGQRVEPRPQLESSLARRLKAEVRERLERARKLFMQAQQDLIEGKLANADSNLKLALQFDPLNEEYKAFAERAKPKLEEGLVKSYLGKAEMAAASGDGKVERQQYEHALALFPDSIDANFAYGLYLVRLEEDPKRAKDCLQKVAAKRPEDITVLVALAKALRLLGMTKNAARILDQAKQLDSRDPRVVAEAKELKRVS